MLETALNMLKMILYILKLLNQSKRSPATAAGQSQAPELKESIQKAVLQLWESAQMVSLSISPLLTHLCLSLVD
jgi:spore coat protein CotF